MKLTLIAIILAVGLCVSAYMVNNNPDIDDLKCRIEQLEIDMAIMQDRFEASDRNAQRVIDKVKEIVATGFSYLIPVDGGFLGIIEKPFDKP